VLLRATMSDAVDGRDARRLRRRPTGETPATAAESTTAEGAAGVRADQAAAAHAHEPPGETATPAAPPETPDTTVPAHAASAAARPGDEASEAASPEVTATADVTPDDAAPDAADTAVPEEASAPPVRPVLRPVAGNALPAGGRRGGATSRRARDRRKGRGTSASRASRRPAPSRPGERPPQRVLRAFSALNFDRLVPADDEARERRAAQFRRLGITVASVALVVLMIYSVFPVRTWINQRDAADRAREQLAAFERENDMLAEEARELREDERIEVLAREMGMVRPGEELYGILPAPEPPSPSPDATSTTRSDG
jgi:cell division protein FtsB